MFAASRYQIRNGFLRALPTWYEMGVSKLSNRLRVFWEEASQESAAKIEEMHQRTELAKSLRNQLWTSSKPLVEFKSWYGKWSNRINTAWALPWLERRLKKRSWTKRWFVRGPTLITVRLVTFPVALAAAWLLYVAASGVALVKLGPTYARFQLFKSRELAARAERRRGLLAGAESSLQDALELRPDDAFFKSRLEDNLSPHGSRQYESFPEFLEDGEIWLDPAKWTNPEKSSVLRSIFTRDLRWPNYPEEIAFSEYEISAEFLDESLARAESLKSLLNYEVEFPVRLETPDLFIDMERDGDMLRSFVGSGAMGVAVSVNLNNWDLHYLSDDSDAMFAAGASLNFFIDCSINLSRHPKYQRAAYTITELAATQASSLSTWTTNAAFAADVEGIRTGRLSQPPKAHRVKGYIRTLTERQPTDEARDRAPAFIRRNMAPNDTFVRPHQRGGGAAAEHLYTRLRTYSSLADFLATAPRL